MSDMALILRHTPRVSSPLNPSPPTSPRSPPPPINILRRRHKHKSVGIGELLLRVKGAVAWEQTKKLDLEVEVDDGAGNVAYYYTEAPPLSPRDIELDCDGDVPMLMDEWPDDGFGDDEVDEEPSDTEDDRPDVDHWGGRHWLPNIPLYLRREEDDGEDSADRDGHENSGIATESIFENMDGMQDVEYTIADHNDDDGGAGLIGEHIEIIPRGRILDLAAGIESPNTTTTSNSAMIEIDGLNSAQAPRRERPRLTRSTQMIHRPESWMQMRLASPGPPVNGPSRASNGMAGQDHIPSPGPRGSERGLGAAVDLGSSEDDNIA
ncbi:uncharacterized protein DNG_02484 [Cephalotrichum gorgonifer]|uniref:Uncharacterized protein n=1 Tax=Cephalotrichum gorgonifer TaxID=2041049 RepID=A0AAE8MSH9_9PEZI|nr:uncharacterized protein DNG_02484 [Cephalotrichum gorgonifer]